jgi:hypothetical protein
MKISTSILGALDRGEAESSRSTVAQLLGVKGGSTAGRGGLIVVLGECRVHPSHLPPPPTPDPAQSPQSSLNLAMISASSTPPRSAP